MGGVLTWAGAGDGCQEQLSPSGAPPNTSSRLSRCGCFVTHESELPTGEDPTAPSAPSPSVPPPSKEVCRASFSSGEVCQEW